MKIYPFSWISRSNIVEMAILPKFQINEIPIKLPILASAEIERTILSFVSGSIIKSPDTQNNPEEKNAEEIMISDLMIYYISIVIKTI